jgi:hypothetical protein
MDKLIGFKAKIKIVGLTQTPVNAKIDTGADICSIHAEDIVIKNETASFTFQNTTVTMPMAGKISVKTADGGIEERPLVNLTVIVPHGDKETTVKNLSFNLNDRSSMESKILLGQNFIENGDFIISSDAEDIAEVKKPMKECAACDSEENGDYSDPSVSQPSKITPNEIIELIITNEITLEQILKAYYERETTQPET